jgi:hypothetical protein
MKEFSSIGTWTWCENTAWIGKPWTLRWPSKRSESEHLGGNPRIVLKSTSLKVVSWNARALLHSDKKIVHAKMKVFLKLLKLHDVVLLQEAHGTIADWQHFEHQFFLSHRMFLSLSEDSNAGGIVNLVAKSTAGNVAIVHEDLAAGRAAFASVAMLHSTISAF